MGIVDLELPVQLNPASEDKKINQLFMIMSKGKNNPDLINKFFQIKLNYRKNKMSDYLNNHCKKIHPSSKKE